MDQFQLLADGLTANWEMLKNTLGDFSDSDLMVRPCPGANHTAWQLGHLCNAETFMVSTFDPNAVVKLPEGFDKKFHKDTSTNDDPKFFGTKAELLDQLGKVRSATIGWVKTLKPGDLDKPSNERLRRMCPTLGHVLGLIPNHFSMHVGQMQVIRRKLGKPLLF
jgi:hypothetical protein